MIEWGTCVVSDSFVRSSIGRNNQIPAKDIALTGKIPVIDQGQNFIAGYCDEVDKVIDNDLPIIVFGDHTRCFKYIDFPFVLGADGTKTLKPNQEKFDPKFYYYALLSLDLPNRGYNRHFKVLKEMSLPVPSVSEQKKIAYILSIVQQAIDVQERIIQITNELKKAFMEKLFTKGLYNEKLKQTEIGVVPESWDVVSLEQKAESFQYGTSVKCSYDVKGKPVLRIPNVVGGHVDIADLKYGVPKKSEIGSLVLKKGDLLFVRTNGVKENAGRCSLFNDELEDCYYASYLIRVRLDPDIINSNFLNEYTRTDVGVSFLSGRAIRTADGKFNINSGTLKSMLVPLPTIDEQNQISMILEKIDTKIKNACDKKNALKNLFDTLLHELMTASIRLN